MGNLLLDIRIYPLEARTHGAMLYEFVTEYSKQQYDCLVGVAGIPRSSWLPSLQHNNVTLFNDTIFRPQVPSFHTIYLEGNSARKSR